jgi:hypothetical protein
MSLAVSRRKPKGPLATSLDFMVQYGTKKGVFLLSDFKKLKIFQVESFEIWNVRLKKNENASRLSQQ